MGVVAVLLVALCCSLSQIISTSSEEQVNLPNRRPVKTVKTRAGIYDCIDIRKQPALDHPLLKNHQIQVYAFISLNPHKSCNLLTAICSIHEQMNPTSIPHQSTSMENKFSAAILTSVGCPKGTVPIRRAGENELIREKSLSKPHVRDVHPMTPGIPGQHLAILRSKDPSQTYFGTRAFISLNNPPVGPHQTSTGQMWAMAGPVEKQNAVEAGWMVSPEIYGDNHTHLFVKATTDGYKTSCYNTKCPSFVQIDENHPIDAVVGPISAPGGQQYIINLELHRQEVNGTLSWWVIVNGTIQIGYFRNDVFTELNGGATYIAWGGLVRAPPGEPSPPMGSGKSFEYDEIKWAGFFTQVSTIDASHSYKGPDDHNLEIYNDSDDCYDFQDVAYKEKSLGYVFLYGGPGGTHCGV